MSIDLVCVGLNHQKAPIEIRERAAFHAMDIDDALRSMSSCDAVNEAAILSTCNRVELYAHGNWSRAQHSLENFLHQYHGIPEQTLTPHIYYFNGMEALGQLFRVATSMDSLIIGEPQILGQVKDAYFRAHKAGTIGPQLTQAFSQAFLTAKRVRRETAIGKNAVSISFAAVELAQKVFGNLNGTSCLLVGAGQTSELAALHFKQKGAQIIVANRSIEHAAQLAKKFEGSAHALEQMGALLESSDIVLTSTHASHFLISQNLMSKVMRKRRYRPIFLIDISVPRNIEPGVNSLDGVYLYNIDDLSLVVFHNFQDRHHESKFAEAIIQEELQSYVDKLQERRLAPIIENLKKQSFYLAKEETQKFLSGFAKNELSLNAKCKIELMAQALANKLLHQSIVELKNLNKKI